MIVKTYYERKITIYVIPDINLKKTQEKKKSGPRFTGPSFRGLALHAFLLAVIRKQNDAREPAVIQGIVTESC